MEGVEGQRLVEPHVAADVLLIGVKCVDLPWDLTTTQISQLKEQEPEQGEGDIHRGTGVRRIVSRVTTKGLTTSKYTIVAAMATSNNNLKYHVTPLLLAPKLPCLSNEDPESVVTSSLDLCSGRNACSSSSVSCFLLVSIVDVVVNLLLTLKK